MSPRVGSPSLSSFSIVCLENDGAAALILVPADRAKDLQQKPVYVLGTAQGAEYRSGAGGHNNPDYATSSFKTVGPNLFEMAEVGPKDVDVVQSYENFTGGRRHEPHRTRLLYLRRSQRVHHL